MEYALDVEIIAAIAILNKLVMFANRDIDLILIIIVEYVLRIVIVVEKILMVKCIAQVAFMVMA